MLVFKGIRSPVVTSGEIRFSLRNKVLRAIWRLVWLICASWTPASLAGWRRLLLRLFGARMASTADVRGGAVVWYPANLVMEDRTVIAHGVNCYNMARVVIQNDSIVSQRVHLCAGTHDYERGSHPLVVKPISIGPNAWIAAEAFVSPGTIVSEGVVVGARAVVFGTLKPWSVYAGNPAVVLKEREFNRES